MVNFIQTGIRFSAAPFINLHKTARNSKKHADGINREISVKKIKYKTAIVLITYFCSKSFS
jgi:hypothetical protein